MAIIPMTKTSFTVIPEGDYVFEITKVDYNEDFGKLTITMKTENNQYHTERFSLMNASGEMNEKACAAFSFFAKTVMNDFEIEEIDPETLVGKYIGGRIVHTVMPSKNDTSRTVTFANMTDKWVICNEPNIAIEEPVHNRRMDLNELLKQVMRC